MCGDADAGQREPGQPAFTETELFGELGGVRRQVRRDPPVSAHHHRPDQLDVELLTERQKGAAIRCGMSIRDWRRDWLKNPNAWKLCVCFAVAWALLAVLNLHTGERFGGIGNLVIALGWVGVAWYTRWNARQGPGSEQDDSQPH
jgi:hypothetical protein